MIYPRGDGLPSTVTAERIKNVLGLARSHERSLRAALDATASPAWTGTDSHDDLYERLRALLTTAEGQKAYEEARFVFEEGKAKRLGRADFLVRLVKSCWKEVLGQPEVMGYAHYSDQDLIERLAQDNAWGRLAEVAWAAGLMSGDSSHVVDVIDAYPEARPYLEDVQAGLMRIEDDEEPSLPEEDGEAGERIGHIRQVAESLDADHLKEQELLSLVRAARRLVEIARARNIRDRDISLQRAQIEDWKTRHMETVAGTAPVEEALRVLEEQIEGGDMDREGVGATLDLAERLLSVDVRYRETREKLKQASDEEDYASVSSIAVDLKSLRSERDRARTAIDLALAETRSAGSSSKAPPVLSGDNVRPPEPETTEREADPRESQHSDDEPAPDDEDEDSRPEASLHNPTQAKNSDQDEELDVARFNEDEDRSIERDERAIATAVESRRLGLAYHLALAAPDALPNANTIKLVACNYVTNERAPIGELSDAAAALLEETKTTNEGVDQPRQRDHAILITCAALAPALTAPGGMVAQLLSLLEPRLGDMPSLRALTKAAADVSMKGIPLPIALLREEDSLEQWRERASTLREETTTWVANERQSKIRFQAATRVWRRMLEEWEQNDRFSLGYMFSLLNRQIEEIDEKRITTISEYWRVYREREIDRIDRENRSSASTNRIDGSARLDLRKKVQQALTFSDRWLTLIQERPDTRPPFHKDQARILRAAVNDNAEQALEEIEALETPLAHGSGELLRRYIALFNNADSDTDGLSVDLTYLLNGDLLVDPNIVFDDDVRPSDSSRNTDVLRDLVTWDTLDFARAAVERARRGDFLGAEAAIDFAQRTGRIDDESADRSRATVDEARGHAQGELKDKIRKTSDRLDAAYAAGVLSLETYEQQQDRIPRGDFTKIGSFIEFSSELDKINKEIEQAQEVRRDAIRRSLDCLPYLSSDKKERIEQAVDSGHFQIAEDFIERVKHGEELPVPETTSYRPFDQFFPRFVDEYVGISGSVGDRIAHVRHVIEMRKYSDFIDARGLSTDASRDGIGVLDAWVSLRDGRTSVRSLSALMRTLGFAHIKVHGSNDETLGGEKVFTLRTVPIADRDIVGLPDFGSRADGKYRLFAIRGRVTGEAVIRETGKWNTAGSTPNIILFLGVLDTDSRRSLAREFSSSEYHPTIVLDEALVVFLAAWPGDRLGALFDCASAFAFSQPFDPDAAEVPPEMFFGRRTARAAILAMSGDMAHFVYGGRRLGKTALLAAIAREYRTRRPNESEELVLLINMKGTGIGENRPTEDLWSLFAEHLVDQGILQQQIWRFDTIEKSIRQWLKEKQGRRILLLVDEADAFLDAEYRPGQNYRVLEQVKRLMEQTERRFKVVFAGLHNVQRAARDPNTPFAHLGEAIHIGPMLPGTDGNGIQNLIRNPLEALGYRFVSNDSVIRVAAETNYYPALAQQFGKELLKKLHEEAGTRDDIGPPYPIHQDTVDRVFDARETRDRIRNLFSWTIQLDPRYEFLTYLIARISFDNENAQPRAVPIANIRDTALSEWQEGFASDPSFWSFEVLLEEMIGLGILREVSDKKYAIRTRNLRMLLGNDEEIERRFIDAKSKMAPPIFDPAQFRNTLEGETPSSLTAHQENQLLSGRRAIGIVFGTRLAGLEQISDSIKRATERRDGSLYVDKITPDTLHEVLRRVSRSRKRGTHVVLVDMRDVWNQEAIESALTFVGEHEPQTRIIRPVFVCGPRQAWEWLNELLPTRKGVELRDIWLGPCARDFIRTWLTEREARVFTSLENLNQPVDLPWPAVAGTAARDKRLKSMNEAIDATLTDDEDNHSVSDILISENANIALHLLSDFPDEPMTADFLSDLSRDEDESAHMSPEEVMNFFSWAHRLGIVYRNKHGYRLDSTYAVGLGRIFER